MTILKEKRQFKRGPLLIPVRYDMQSEAKKGYMTDLSEGGCRIYCYSPTPVQDNNPISVFFNLKNSQDNISVQGQIVRTAPFIPPILREENTRDFNHELGIKFLDLTEKECQAIENFINMVPKGMKQE
jgi:hypothetical protein